MSDVEIHVKRRYASNQTLCMELRGTAMDAIDVNRAMTFHDIVMHSVTAKFVSHVSCIACLTALQAHLLDIVKAGASQINALHQSSLDALDTHIAALKVGP